MLFQTFLQPIQSGIDFRTKQVIEHPSHRRDGFHLPQQLFRLLPLALLSNNPGEKSPYGRVPGRQLPGFLGGAACFLSNPWESRLRLITWNASQ